jgi:hypothetical protein
VLVQEAAMLRTVLEAASGVTRSTAAAAAERRCVPRAATFDTFGRFSVLGRGEVGAFENDVARVHRAVEPLPSFDSNKQHLCPCRGKHITLLHAGLLYHCWSRGVCDSNDEFVTGSEKKKREKR